MGIESLKYQELSETGPGKEDSQGRSGRVAFPRLKTVLVGWTLLGMEERARRDQRADGRSMATDMASLLEKTNDFN